MLKLYAFAKVNSMARGHTRDLRVLWALEEMQLPFEIVGLDHPAQDLNSEAFRTVSPFEQIPAIDDDGVVLTESAAIVMHLARKSGRLMPADPQGEAQVMRWAMAAMNTVEVPLLNLLLLDWTCDGGDGKYRAFLVGWANRHLGNLERWLADRTFLATESFTVADLLMAHVLNSVTSDELLAPHPRVIAYRDHCLARPAWQRTLEAYFARVQPG